MTDVLLRQGEANPNDVKLIDPTASPAQSVTSLGGIATTEAIGALTINAAVLALGAIASAEALGAPRMVGVVRFAAIASGEAIGSPFLPGSVTGLGAIATAAALGSPTLRATVALVGVTSAEALGAPTLSYRISALGAVATTESIGAPTLGLAGPATLSDLGGIASAEAIGAAGFFWASSDTSAPRADRFWQRTRVPTSDVVAALGGITSSETVAVPTLIGLDALDELEMLELAIA